MLDKLEVVVTQEHIEAGQVCSSSDCPIALAVRDMMRTVPEIADKPYNVTVFGTYGWVEYIPGPNPWLTTSLEFALPPVAYQFVETFDNGGSKKVKPVSFTLYFEDDHKSAANI